MDHRVIDRIRDANVQVHKREAAIYDAVHPEIFGYWEQRRINRDLDCIASLVPEDAGSAVLDVGCGTGNLTLKYLARGYKVTACDLSPDMMAVLRARMPRSLASRAELIVDSAERVLSSGSGRRWDVISFSSVLHHLADYRSVLCQALKSLQRRGHHLCLSRATPARSGDEARKAACHRESFGHDR